MTIIHTIIYAIKSYLVLIILKISSLTLPSVGLLCITVSTLRMKWLLFGPTWHMCGQKKKTESLITPHIPRKNTPLYFKQKQALLHHLSPLPPHRRVHPRIRRWDLHWHIPLIFPLAHYCSPCARGGQRERLLIRKLQEARIRWLRVCLSDVSQLCGQLTTNLALTRGSSSTQPCASLSWHGL